MNRNSLDWFGGGRQDSKEISLRCDCNPEIYSTLLTKRECVVY